MLYRSPRSYQLWVIDHFRHPSAVFRSPRDNHYPTTIDLVFHGYTLLRCIPTFSNIVIRRYNPVAHGELELRYCLPQRTTIYTIETQDQRLYIAADFLEISEHTDRPSDVRRYKPHFQKKIWYGW